MKVPTPMIKPMRMMLKVGIPFLWVFVATGFLIAIFALFYGPEWGAVGIGLLFSLFSYLMRMSYIRMLDSLDRTGTTYKWRWKVD